MLPIILPKTVTKTVCHSKSRRVFHSATTLARNVPKIINTTVSLGPKTGIKNGTATKESVKPVTAKNKEAIKTLTEIYKTNNISVIFSPLLLPFIMRKFYNKAVMPRYNAVQAPITIKICVSLINKC